MAWIHDLPLWLVAISTLFVFVGGSFLGLAVSRRWSRRRGLHALVDNGVIGWIFSAILGIYAIAVGLIAVATWGNASEASSVASHEAAEIAALYRDLAGYSQPIQGALEEILARYTRGIIEQDWPVQRLGEEPHGGMPILHEFTSLLYAFEPATEAQRAAHAEALQAFNRLIEFRTLRLEAVNYAVPNTLWSVVLLGALVSITASYVFNMESFWVHATMTSLLAAMVGLLVFFILVTDLPYRGENGIGPQAYELVLHDVIEARAGR
jgi:hypothetical protein